MGTIGVSGYLPNGAYVTVTIDVADMARAVDEGVALTDLLLKNGFAIKEVEGEEEETVGWVVRRVKESAKTGDESDVIDLYFDHEAVEYKFLTVYLNTTEERAAFEAISGLKIAKLPLWPGNHIQRGAGKESDKYIVRVPRVFTTFHKPNPKYNPEEPDAKKRKPKRLFVRWGAVQNGTQNAQSGANSGATQEKVSEPTNAQNGSKTIAWDREAVKLLSAEFELDAFQLKRALGIDGAWGEWTAGYEAARKTVADYKNTLELDFMS